MILINQIKLKPDAKENALRLKAASILKVLPEDIISLSIEKKSIDARKKPDIFIVYSIACEVKHEESVLRRHAHNNQVSLYKPVKYTYEITGKEFMRSRPIIVGAGPAGLFCAYFLAKAGYKPILIERGFDIDTRTKDVENFWATGNLNRNSNVLFGEGGAGTFSDGKLNTLVKDKFGRNKEVLEIFVKYGANPNILYEAKPHIGTDVLRDVIKAMREDIKAYGGEIRFNAELTDISINDGRVSSVTINSNNTLECDNLVLCIGHSARDTFKMLYDKGLKMEQKDFAVGFRIEHSQKMIDKALYTDNEEILKYLPPASYKLTYKSTSGRGVYSFCMCPGGYVVNASSEPECLCVNGMSYSKRDGENANSAIVVSVSSKDYESEHPLAGVEFQRKIERNAYKEGNGAIPVEFYSDFKAEVNGFENLNDQNLDELMAVKPQTKGVYTKAKVSSILPKEMSEAIVEGIDYFNKIIPGFSNDFALLSAVESRTSSPVRITREDDSFESINVKGVYPCGEGAGYAGGITSAAMDGMKVFEKIISKYKPF